MDQSDASKKDVAILVGLLISGLIVLVPILSYVTGIPIMVAVVIVGGLYAATALYRRAILVSSVIGIIVTSTFAANIPIRPVDSDLMPGHLGPNIWLVQVAIISAVGVVLFSDRDRLRDTWGSECWLCVGFLAWIPLSAVASRAPRLDVALYFTLLTLTAFLAFLIVKYTIRNGILSLQTIVTLVLVTISGHLIYGLAQLANGRTFGLTQLGEPQYGQIIAEIHLGSATVPIGAFVTGFAGMTFHIGVLASLCVVLPFALYWILDEASLLLVIPPLSAVIARATTSDAIRGGYLIALVSAAVVVGIAKQRGWPQMSLSRRRTLSASIVALVSVGIILLPSTMSGASSESRPLSGTDGTQSSADGSIVGESVPSSPEIVESLSIPLFDLTNLSIRVQQYLLGIDLFTEHPLFGIGAGNFKFYGAAVDPSLSLPLHNFYLAVLVETGVVGFTLYFGAITLIVTGAVRTLFSGALRCDALVFIALLAALLGQFAIGFWDHMHLTKITVAVPFWITLGALAGGSEVNT